MYIVVLQLSIMFPNTEKGKLYFMTVKLFLLGLPGSGKSTVARHIEAYVRDRSLSAIRISDYAILRKMYEEDSGHKRFMPAEHEGFNVIDLTVCDIALQKLEVEIIEHFAAGS